MKTATPLYFRQLGNEFLENILRQLVEQQHVLQVFFTPRQSSTMAHLVVHLEQKAAADQLQGSKWVRKARKLYRTNVYFIYSTRLLHQSSIGHPFVACYCMPSALLYERDGAGKLAVGKRGWKAYKKKFNRFADGFRHDHDLHRTQIGHLIADGSPKSVLTSYERLIEHDLEYLEGLFAGHAEGPQGLDARIENLVAYVPEIQRCFVAKGRGCYFLTDVFTKAREADADEDIAYGSEMYAAIDNVEQGLYRLIEERLAAMKHWIRKGKLKRLSDPAPPCKVPNDKIPDVVMATLLKSVAVEQAYLFHQATYGATTTYYLLLIGDGLGNELLRSLAQSLKSGTDGNPDLVLLGHNRHWIQKHLYQHQPFFMEIVQERHLVYSSSPHHPDLHWEVPHHPYHADLYLLYRDARNAGMQFGTIARDPKGNYHGLGYLLALFFLSFCRTFVFVKTYYLPHHLSNQALWQLCLYADPSLRKHEYLMGQFWTEFFPFVDRHRTLHHRLDRLDKEQVEQMQTLVDKLMEELYRVVAEGGLLGEVREDRSD